MVSTRIGTQVNVKHCFLCQEDTGYFCYDCRQDLCSQCKKLHVIDISTKNHEVTNYKEKMKYLFKLKNEQCQDMDSRGSRKQAKRARSRRSKQVISVLSGKSVQRPRRFPLHLWLSPSEHSVNDEMERQRYSKKIHYIRSKTIYSRRVMLEGLRHDLKIGHKDVIIRGRSKAIKEGQRLKDLIDDALAGDLEDRCIIQKTRMTRQINKLLWNVQRYEQLNNTMLKKPVKFLRVMTRKHDAKKNSILIVTRKNSLLREARKKW